jgi:hypothetical protein
LFVGFFAGFNAGFSFEESSFVVIRVSCRSTCLAVGFFLDGFIVVGVLLGFFVVGLLVGFIVVGFIVVGLIVVGQLVGLLLLETAKCLALRPQHPRRRFSWAMAGKGWCIALIVSSCPPLAGPSPYEG